MALKPESGPLKAEIADELEKSLGWISATQRKRQMREIVSLLEKSSGLSEEPESDLSTPEWVDAVMRDNRQFPWPMPLTRAHLKAAQAAESPEELVLAILPSDGHLD